jgi:hypothetical protein
MTKELIQIRMGIEQQAQQLQIAFSVRAEELKEVFNEAINRQVDEFLSGGLDHAIQKEAQRIVEREMERLVYKVVVAKTEQIEAEIRKKLEKDIWEKTTYEIDNLVRRSLAKIAKNSEEDND